MRGMATDLRANFLADPVLAQLVDVAAGAPTYVVGGAVRDMLCEAPAGPDVDVVVEGDAVAIARALGRVLDATPRTHPRFGTAEIQLADGRVLDLVTARTERYAEPGALPEVSPAGIAEDLARRDFTVNAMAVGLTDGTEPLLDPHGGVADLAAEVVRALRLEAFAEDPSRVVRAARYCARLGFTMDSATEAAAAAVAVGLDPSSARVADELSRLAGEASAGAALDILARLGVAWIHTEHRAAIDAVGAVLAWPGAPEEPAWRARLGLAVAGAGAESLAVPGRDAAAIVAAARAPVLVAALRGASCRSQVDEILRAASPTAEVAAAALGAPGVADWWASWRDLRLHVTGQDLIALGLRGPAVGRSLSRLRALVLDGELYDDRDSQLARAQEER